MALWKSLHRQTEVQLSRSVFLYNNLFRIMKILIADDHPVVREGLKQIIKKLKIFSVLDEADNGNEALNKIELNKYDLIIMDISMPGKSGLDILKTLKDKNEKQTILMLSIHPQEQYA